MIDRTCAVLSRPDVVLERSLWGRGQCTIGRQPPDPSNLESWVTAIVEAVVSAGTADCRHAHSAPDLRCEEARLD